MLLGWLSDIHLNFLNRYQSGKFFSLLSSQHVDGWLLSGDIADARSLLRFLERFNDKLDVPTYFVLGNHDFFGDSIASVTAKAGELVKKSERLIWLTASEPQFINSNITVVGDDTWADARFGDPKGTPIELNDFIVIKELTGHSRKKLIRTLNQLGDESAARLAPKLENAASQSSLVVVLTHVPPFSEATWHKGKISSGEFLPWFSCKAVGDAIIECARSYPGTNFQVLCGHTHGAGVCSPASNVTVMTALAEYGAPIIQKVLEYP